MERGGLLRVAVALGLFAGGAGVAFAAGVGANGPPEYYTTSDTTPPEISCSASPATLSPPNHKLRAIAVNVTVTDTASNPTSYELLSVTSSQADSGLGEDDAPNDIQGWTTGTADTAGSLRAERFGNARVYTLTYRGYDAATNSADCQTTVTVPKGKTK